MSDRVTFGVDAANALLGLGRRVRDNYLRDSLVTSSTVTGLFAPYTLADDEPLTAEQTRVVCEAEPGLCFRVSGMRGVRRYMDGKWQLWGRGKWVSRSVYRPYGDSRYTLARDPEATQKEPYTPSKSPGQALPRKTMFALGAEEWPGGAKVVEEAAEVIQVVGKLMATYGDPNHWSGDLNHMLVEELGDLTAAMSFFIEESRLDSDAIDARCAEKLRLFRAWHRGEDPGYVSRKDRPEKVTT